MCGSNATSLLAGNGFMLILWRVMCFTLSTLVARLLQPTWMHSCSDLAVAYALPADYATPVLVITTTKMLAESI
jgi:hypothetical protein